MKMNIPALKNELLEIMGSMKDRMINVSNFLYENPEVGRQEFKAVKRLTEELKKDGFEVAVGIAHLKTAFRGEFRKGKPTIAFLCEYDALPEIGHGCGHNLHGTMSLYAGIVLKKILEKHNLHGTVRVVGTPAEENYGDKVLMVQKGVFEKVDAAIIVHSGDRNSLAPIFLAEKDYVFQFVGRPAHAASAPDKGINALNGVIHTINGINALRQHVKDHVRIHYIITNGGHALNIVPERAEVQIGIRSLDVNNLGEVIEKVFNCAKGAALATGTKFSWNDLTPRIDNVLHNRVMGHLFKKNLRSFGFKFSEKQEVRGTTDVGAVSQVVPTIHPIIQVAPKGTIPHTREFREATKTEMAYKALYAGATSLAMTALDLIVQPKLLEQAKNELKNRSGCSDK